MPAGPKGAEEKAAGHSSVGESTDTPLLPQGSHKVWLRTRKFLSLGSDWGPGSQLRRGPQSLEGPLKMKQLGPPGAQRTADQAMQKPGGDSFQKDIVDLCQREQQALSTHRTKNNLLQTHIRPTPREKADFPLLITTRHRVQGPGLKWLQLEMKRLHCLHTQPYYCKVYTLELKTVEHDVPRSCARSL